ncbi:MAG TPA: hypothetical protein VLK35_17340 [Methylomirabilota bacterium]|nr:hypothetical protein [Methylomirabilota bacterium]
MVNVVGGAVWLRQAAVRDGLALYAPEKCGSCPEFVMVTYAELEARGIVGSAYVLPVPVVPEPSGRERLRADFVTALDNAHRTHPCPVTGRPYWTGCVHYDETGHVAGVGSCHSERRADAVLAVRDTELERLRARIVELEAERHSTNEALDDAVQALRAVPKTVFRASHDSIVMGHYTTREAAQAHCEAKVQEEEPEGSILHLSWSADDIGPDAEYELHITPTRTGGLIRGTGYVVTPVEVASAYDPDADE